MDINKSIKKKYIISAFFELCFVVLFYIHGVGAFFPLGAIKKPKLWGRLSATLVSRYIKILRQDKRTVYYPLVNVYQIRNAALAKAILGEEDSNNESVRVTSLTKLKILFFNSLMPGNLGILADNALRKTRNSVEDLSTPLYELVYSIL